MRRKIYMFFSKLTMCLGISAIILSGNVVKAADGDFYDKKTGEIYINEVYIENDQLMDKLIDQSTDRPSDFIYEKGNQGYNYKKVLEAYLKSKSSGKTVMQAFKEAISNKNAYEEIPNYTNDDLDVVDIY